MLDLSGTTDVAQLDHRSRKKNKRNKRNARRRKKRHKNKIEFRQNEKLIKESMIDPNTWDGMVHCDLDQWDVINEIDNIKPKQSWWEWIVTSVYA